MDRIVTYLFQGYSFWLKLSSVLGINSVFLESVLFLHFFQILAFWKCLAILGCLLILVDEHLGRPSGWLLKGTSLPPRESHLAGQECSLGNRSWPQVTVCVQGNRWWTVGRS